MDAVERGYGPQGDFMARLIQQLTEARIRTLTKIGLHHDGAGLYLQIKPGGARSWINRFRLNSRTRDMGLGALADVSLVKDVRFGSKADILRDLRNVPLYPQKQTLRHLRSLSALPSKADIRAALNEGIGL
jgi:hypothetical protein